MIWLYDVKKVGWMVQFVFVDDEGINDVFCEYGKVYSPYWGEIELFTTLSDSELSRLLLGTNMVKNWRRLYWKSKGLDYEDEKLASVE